MKLFHISHTDLDGFGCQLLTNEFFQDAYFYNANYGIEVKLSIQKVLSSVKNHKNQKILFLISDLNLTLQESKELEDSINKLIEEGFNIKLQLLDHHITGQKSFEKYSWYFLDDKRSATKIVYDYLINEYNAPIKHLEKLVDCINSVDIWLDNDKSNFEFGKVLMSMISKSKEINSILFSNLHRDFKFFLLKESINYINQDNAHIKLDNEIHFLKKKFLNQNKEDNTLDNLSANFLVKCLNELKEELTIFYNEQKGIFTYCLGSISIPANEFLKANKDYDFFIDINKKGSASLRANGKIDVSMLALKLGNGGGHLNASGCKFEDFKETIDIQEVKSFLQSKLNNLK